MKKWLSKIIALIMVLALFAPAISSAEEKSEVDLYAPEVYDGTVAAEAPETSEDEPMSAETPAEKAPADAEMPMSAAEPAADEPAVYAVAAPEAYPASLLLGAKEKYTLNGLTLSGGQPVTYTSSNPKLVTVDANGLVTAKKAGGAEITCCLGETPLAVCAVTVAKAPKKVILPAKSVVLGLGEWRAFGATLPEGSAGAVSYTSDNPAVLVVDEAGNIGGAGPGTAKLTATAYNGKKATCAVQVLNGPSPTWVSLSQSEATMMAKGTLQLYAGYDAGCDAILGYSTSDRKIATVDGNGLVTAKKGGQATVTVTTHNGLTASCLVTVYTAPKKVSLSAKKLTLNVGEGAQLTAAITANSVTELTWSTSDAAVAAVDGNGYVYATGAGKATVTVTTTNGKKAKCSVKVNGPAVPSAPKKVTLNAKKATLNVGEGCQLVATLPANSISDLTWSTSNAAVAVVDANGYVTVVGPGKATITVVTVNGKKASFKVTVKGENRPTENTDDWSSTYERYVLGDLHAKLFTFCEIWGEDMDLCYVLYDMDRNGIPELIVFNGGQDMASLRNYVFEYKNGEISYIGDVGFRVLSFEDQLYYFDSKEFPGIFCETGASGIGIIEYSYMENGVIYCEEIKNEVDYDELEYMYDLGRVVYHEDYADIILTNNDGLLALAEQSTGRHYLKSYDSNKIRTIGWTAFVKECLE